MPENSLSHLKDFERLLNHYAPKIEVMDMLDAVKLVVLVAPAGAGRNTIINELVLTGKYYFLVSDTTRHPRINNGNIEVSGHEYWFSSEEKMLDGVKHGDYVAPALIHRQQVSGVHITELQKAAELKKIAITDMEIQGSDAVQEYKPDTLSIFILPPDFNEWMKRLDGRGAMDPAEKRRRLESAFREVSGAMKRPYFKYVINWDRRVTAEEIHMLAQGNPYQESSRINALAHAELLLKDIKAHI